MLLPFIPEVQYVPTAHLLAKVSCWPCACFPTRTVVTPSAAAAHRGVRHGFKIKVVHQQGVATVGGGAVCLSRTQFHPPVRISCTACFVLSVPYFTLFDDGTGWWNKTVFGGLLTTVL